MSLSSWISGSGQAWNAKGWGFDFTVSKDFEALVQAGGFNN